MGIAENIKATGIAEVMVILTSKKSADVATSTEAPTSINKHFINSSVSQDAALLELLTARRTLLQHPVAAAETSAVQLGNASKLPSKTRFYPNLGIVLGTVDRAGLSGLRKERGVAKVVSAPQLRLIKPVATAFAKPQTGYSWGLKSLGIDKMHNMGFDGAGVLIGHLDTGVDGSHPALKGAIQYYAEFDTLGNQSKNTIPRDSGEHGTHTAGTIVGRTVSRVSFGVAPGATLASGMVIEGGNVLARILAGMNWIVGLQVRVLSMSLGLIGTAETFLPITRVLRSRGVLPVFAVGNEGAGSSRYPGNYAECLSVGAMGSNGIVADFSGSQQFIRSKDPLVPDLVAPGVDVISCIPNNQYAQMSGTSMATPHIAGMAALLMQAKPTKTISQIEAALFASCVMQPGMLKSRANRGLPNVIKALSLL